MEQKLVIFWFRQDLRITDNIALFESAKSKQVMPVYILDLLRNSNSAGEWWLNKSLESLNKSLSDKLNVYIGNPKDILSKLVKNYNVSAVFWNRCYDASSLKADDDIIMHLENLSVEAKVYNGNLLWDPSKILNKNGEFYKIYGAFYRFLNSNVEPRISIEDVPEMRFVKDSKNLKFSFDSSSHKHLEERWEAGEIAAKKRLDEFLEKKLAGYAEGRNYPAGEFVSRLSPHLHFGEISPNQVWYAVRECADQAVSREDIEVFSRELAWREFSYYLLYHFPDLPFRNYQKKFDGFKWSANKEALSAWQQGRTGYPIVDAGMRELLETGYMHNRLRMIVASFLVKNLNIDWREGAAWFMEHLVDGDIANNSNNWQWVAGSGLDSAPYFRIFNPVLQSKRFDPEGLYIRKFVPELKSLPIKYLFAPWEAPEKTLLAAKIVIGSNYPKPIVNLEVSRANALKNYRLLS